MADGSNRVHVRCSKAWHARASGHRLAASSLCEKLGQRWTDDGHTVHLNRYPAISRQRPNVVFDVDPPYTTLTLSARGQFYTSESEVCRNPRTEKIKRCIMAADSLHKYSRESQRTKGFCQVSKNPRKTRTGRTPPTHPLIHFFFENTWKHSNNTKNKKKWNFQKKIHIRVGA